MADDERPLLPELARSLRSLGRPDDAAAATAHAVVFVPLLDARARASRGDASEVLSSLRGAALAARMEALARAAAAEGEPDPAQVRARTAAAREALDPLRAELRTLDSLSFNAGQGGTDSPAWELWVAQLRRVFSTADAAFDALALALAHRPEPAPTPKRRWFGLRRGGPR